MLLFNPFQKGLVFIWLTFLVLYKIEINSRKNNFVNKQSSNCEQVPLRFSPICQFLQLTPNIANEFMGCFRFLLLGFFRNKDFFVLQHIVNYISITNYNSNEMNDNQQCLPLIYIRTVGHS